MNNTDLSFAIIYDSNLLAISMIEVYAKNFYSYNTSYNGAVMSDWSGDSISFLYSFMINSQIVNSYLLNSIIDNCFIIKSYWYNNNLIKSTIQTLSFTLSRLYNSFFEHNVLINMFMLKSAIDKVNFYNNNISNNMITDSKFIEFLCGFQ